MPRLGFLYKSDRKGFFNKLKELYDICVESLEIKRQRLNENFKKGLMPYSSIYLENFDNHFSTIGILGMHECCQNFFNSKDAGIQTKEGTQLAIDVLDTLRELIIDTQKHTGNIYNLEGVPGEGTTYRFARLDKRYFGDRIIQSGSAETPFYTNSTQLPVDYTSDMVEALTHQNELQTKYSGGSVLHLFLGEEIKDEQVVARLVKKIAENFKIPYFTLTPSFSICPVHGYIPGIHETCPFDAYQHATEKQDLDK
jgi:ribonucleoside-triphosphate reductase